MLKGIMISLLIIGLITGCKEIKENRKKQGIIGVVLSILTPTLTKLWVLKKKEFVFGGSDISFLIQTAMVDKRIEPYLLLFLWILLLIWIIEAWIKIGKRKTNKSQKELF